jgi:hypothetical protein
MKIHQLLLLACLLVCFTSSAQKSIYTKEGRVVLNRSSLITNCLKSLNKDRSDKTALAICECQVAKIDRKFTNKQYQKHTNGLIINIQAMIQEDSVVNREIQDCFKNSGKTILLQAEGFEQEFIADCEKSVRSSTEKELDRDRVHNFCLCQLQLVKTKKLSDEEMHALGDPNSVLYYELMYRCGNPYAKKGDVLTNASTDITGPQADTISVLTIDGMSYVKIKIGSQLKVWLLDTGASDLLVNTDMEEALKKDGIITNSNYLGVGEYELANGSIDTCRRYRINALQIGGFTIDNVILAVTEKGKRIIAGKTILNKFKSWSLNNSESKLVLSR